MCKFRTYSWSVQFFANGIEYGTIHAHTCIQAYVYIHVYIVNYSNLHVVTSIASSNGCFLHLNSINHVKEINMRISFPNRGVPKCSFHLVVILHTRTSPIVCKCTSTCTCTAQILNFIMAQDNEAIPGQLLDGRRPSSRGERGRVARLTPDLFW